MKKLAHETLMAIAKIAYQEGRQHAFDDAYPDVGMHFSETFEDTKVYQIIMDAKEKFNIET